VVVGVAKAAVAVVQVAAAVGKVEAAAGKVILATVVVRAVVEGLSRSQKIFPRFIDLSGRVAITAGKRFLFCKFVA
jgi:hypothetical protein